MNYILASLLGIAIVANIYVFDISIATFQNLKDREARVAESCNQTHPVVTNQEQWTENDSVRY